MSKRKSFFLASFLTLAAAGAGDAEVRFMGGDGASAATAIIVIAPEELEGVLAEYSWLGQKYGGWKKLSQALVRDGGRSYDVFKISKGSDSKTVYFDITSFIGKVDSGDKSGSSGAGKGNTIPLNGL